VELAMSEELVAVRYVEGSIDFVEMVMLVAKYGLSLQRTLSWAQSANVLAFYAEIIQNGTRQLVSAKSTKQHRRKYT
jgi:hypothetical protein